MLRQAIDFDQDHTYVESMLNALGIFFRFIFDLVFSLILSPSAPLFTWLKHDRLPGPGPDPLELDQTSGRDQTTEGLGVNLFSHDTDDSPPNRRGSR